MVLRLVKKLALPSWVSHRLNFPLGPLVPSSGKPVSLPHWLLARGYEDRVNKLVPEGLGTCTGAPPAHRTSFNPHRSGGWASASLALNAHQN